MVETATKVPVKTATAQPPVRKPEAASESSGYPLSSLRRQIDRLFDDFTVGWGAWPFGRSLFDESAWQMPKMEFHAPAMDVTEGDDTFTVTAEMPGMDEKDVEVTVSDDVLTIKGEKRVEKDEERKGYRLSERRYGLFHRSFGLPAGVDTAKISAEFAKGVLKVTMPKTAEAQQKQPRKIAVKGA